MSEAILGYGTLLQRWSGTAFVTVAEQTVLGGPNLQSDDVPVTNHDSVNSKKEYVGGMIDTGEITFSGNHIPGNASQKQLLTDQIARTVSDWRLVWPDATDIDNRTKATFEAYVKGLSFNSPTETQLTISGTIKLAGDVEYDVTDSTDFSALVVTGYPSSGVLTPTPVLTASVYAYGYTAVHGDTTVKINPTSAASTEIQIDGIVVASGSTSGSITIDYGPNIITAKTKDPDKNPTFYSLFVTRSTA